MNARKPLSGRVMLSLVLLSLIISVAQNATAGSTQIPFTTNGVTSAGASVNAITSGGNPNLWLCGGAEGASSGFGHGIATSYTTVSKDYDNYDAAIGYQTKNGCRSSDTGPFGGVALGANTMLPYQFLQMDSDDACSGTCSSMTLSIPSSTFLSNSFVVIIAACGFGSAGGNGAGTCNGVSGNIIGIPAGCITQQVENKDGGETAALYTCNSLASGDYNIEANNNNGGVDMAIGAFIFANTTPYYLSFNSVTVSNAMVDAGQTEAMTAYIYNGVGPYTYNFLVYNAIGSQVANYLSPSTSATSNAFALPITAPMQSGTFTADLMVTDLTTGVTTTKSTTFMVYNSLTVSIGPSPATIAEGQSLLLTATSNRDSQPDALVRHSSGNFAGYYATANTDQARGQALLNAFSLQNLSSGDTIYLKAETYALEYGTLNLGGTMQNLSLHGAGKYSTIVQNDAPFGVSIINIGINSMVSDLSIIGTASPGDYQFPYGMKYSSNLQIGNSVVRNVYIKGDTDGVYLRTLGSGTISGNLSFYNLTSNTLWDAFVITTTGSGSSGTIHIFDSNFITNGASGADSGLEGRAIISQTSMPIYVVNTIATVTGGTGYQAGVSTILDGFAGSYGNVMVYGGSIRVPSLASNDFSISNQAGSISTNSTLALVGNTNGTITPLGNSPYGAYQYSMGPIAPPLGVSYQWYSDPSCTVPITGATSNTYLASPTNTTTYCVKATTALEATTPATATANSIVTVIPASTTTTMPQSEGPPTTGGLPPATSTSVTTTSTTTSTTTATTTVTAMAPSLVNSTYSVTSSPNNVTIGEAGSISLSSKTLVFVRLRITNVTNSIIPMASNITVAAFNVSVVDQANMTLSQNVTLTMALRYPCSIPSDAIAPYKLLGGGKWIPITPFSVNSSSCTVTFKIPPDPVVALFESLKPTTTLPGSTTMPITSSTITIPQEGRSEVSGYVPIVAIAIVIAVIFGVAYYLLGNRRAKK